MRGTETGTNLPHAETCAIGDGPGQIEASGFRDVQDPQIHFLEMVRRFVLVRSGLLPFHVVDVVRSHSAANTVPTSVFPWLTRFKRPRT